MATLDPRFFCTSDLDTYYVDNASGLPMSGGIVTFYSDVNRTTLKPVYQLTGTPGNYSYAPLNNPCTLSSSGTFQDGLGNNIVPYYYPFEGTPEQNTGVQELYYITVVNSGFVPQFIRQGWPQAAANGNVPPVSDDEVDNYIPNGQFLAHNNIVSITEPPVRPLTFTTASGGVAVYEQQIAQGGWHFVYSQSSSATFNNSFSTIPATGGWGMNSFPRYIFNFNCTSIGNSPQYRDLRIEWPDVNKFSSGNPPGSILFTLFFDARSNDMNVYTFTIYQVYYYGTGGSPGFYVENIIGTVTIGPNASFQSYNLTNIVFPPNDGSIGTNNDDYVGITIRGPLSGWNVSFSDFLLAQGNDAFTSFPIQTNDQMLSRGVAGWMPTPNPNGNDLYLPLILTPWGMKFDQSVIGQIIGKPQIAALPNEIAMNGSQAYIASGYSNIGIPYKRLMNYLLLNSPAVSISATALIPANTIPLFGTGPQFVTLFNVAGFNSEFYIQMNTAAASGTATGVSASITIAATSANNYYTATVASVPLASDYWTFTAPTSGLIYNVWYTVNGIGTAPTAPTGENIMVALVTGDTTGTTAAKTIAIVNQYQFYIPNMAGLFLRGLDTTGIYDLDYASRLVPGIMFNSTDFTGANIGSIEMAAFLQHTHTVTITGDIENYCAGGASSTYNTTGGAGNTTFTSANANQGGGTETRPVNLALNWFIKY